MFLQVPFSFTHTTLLLLIVWGVEAGLGDTTYASLVRLECCPLWGGTETPTVPRHGDRGVRLTGREAMSRHEGWGSRAVGAERRSCFQTYSR